jgi:hypothetical protein
MPAETLAGSKCPVKIRLKDRVPSLVVYIECRCSFCASCGVDENLYLSERGTTFREKVLEGVPVLHIRDNTERRPAKCLDLAGGRVHLFLASGSADDICPGLRKTVRYRASDA